MVMDALGEGLMLGVGVGVGEQMINGSRRNSRQQGNYYVDRIMGEDEITPLSQWSTIDQASAQAKTASLDKKYVNFPVGVFQGKDSATPLQGYVNGKLKTQQQIQAIVRNGWKPGEVL